MTSTINTIGRRLTMLRTTARVAMLGTGLAWILLGMDIFLLVTLGADFIFHLEWGFRLALLIGGVTLLLLAINKLLFSRLQAELTDQDLALALERSHPFLHQLLVSALQFSRRLSGPGNHPSESTSLMQASLAKGEEAALQVSASRGLGWRRLKQQGLLLGVAILLPALAGLAMPRTMSIWLDRLVLLRNTPWPQYTFLTVLGANSSEIHAPRGEDYHLFIKANGRIPSTGKIYWSTATGKNDQGRLTRVGSNRLRFVFHALARPLSFTITAGDAETTPVRIIPVDRPELTRLTLLVDEPDYTGRPQRQVDLLAAQGVVRVLDRSLLTLIGETTKPLSAAILKATRREYPGQLDPENPNRFSVRLHPRATLTIQIRPIDHHGLGPKPAPRVRIETLADQPPRVELKALGIGAMVTPRVRIPLYFHCTDDVALTAVSLKSALFFGSENEQPQLTETKATGLEAFTSGVPDFTNELLWSAKNLKLVPGPTLLLAATATDNFSPGDPHTSQTPLLRCKVVTEEVLLKELHRRQQEIRAELEAANDSLKALRDDLATRLQAEKQLPRILHGFVVQLADAANGMSAILNEWRNNRLPGTEKITAMTFSVVDPLRNQAVSALSRAREQAAAWLMGQADTVEKITPEIDLALAALKRVLKTLSQLEDFQRVVEITRSLLRTQSEARKSLETKLQETLRDLFGEQEKDE